MRKKYNELDIQKLIIQDKIEENKYNNIQRKIQVADQLLAMCERHGIDGEEKNRLINAILEKEINSAIMNIQDNTNRILQYNGLNINSINIQNGIDQRI